MSDTETQFYSKFRLWTKYMQAGKTAEIQKAIKQFADNGMDYFHIIFCSNNLFLSNQTAQRINATYNDIIETDGNKEFFNSLKAIVYSSKSKKCNKYRDLTKMIREGGYRSLMCCTNLERLKDIEELIETKYLTKIIVWVDEIHDRFDSTVKYLKKYAESSKVIQIIGITATPEPVFKKSGKSTKIQIKPMDACDVEKYYGFDECKKIEIDYTPNQYIVPDYILNQPKYKPSKPTLFIGNGINLDLAVEPSLYIHTLLEKNEIIYNKNDVIFVPGAVKMKSHDAIREVLLHHNFYVFVFNSEGHFLYKDINQSERINLNKDEDLKDATDDFQCSLGKIMGKAKEIFELNDKPIGITGFLSIGQGNTLCDYDTKFYITKTVLPYKNANSVKNVQVTGRSFGNLKHKDEFKKSEYRMFGRPVFFQQLKNKIYTGACSEYAEITGNNFLCFNDLKDVINTIRCKSEEKKEEEEQVVAPQCGIEYIPVVVDFRAHAMVMIESTHDLRGIEELNKCTFDMLKDPDRNVTYSSNKGTLKSIIHKYSFQQLHTIIFNDNVNRKEKKMYFDDPWKILQPDQPGHLTTSLDSLAFTEFPPNKEIFIFVDLDQNNDTEGMSILWYPGKIN